MENISPPSIITLFRELLEDDIHSRNFKDLFPWFFTLCLVAGTLFATMLDIPQARDKSNLVAIFSALITAQGILLALSVNSMQQVYLSISTGDFSVFLAKRKILNGYIFFIQLHQIVGIGSLCFLVISAFSIYANFNLNVTFNGIMDYFGGFDRIVFIIMSLALGVFSYSIKQTWDTFTMAKDLTFYKSYFDNLSTEDKESLHSSHAKRD